MMFRVCWMELTYSSSYGASIVLDGSTVIINYGASCVSYGTD